jgi:NDP-sugar pyrophosphorylase family protein
MARRTNGTNGRHRNGVNGRQTNGVTGRETNGLITREELLRALEPSENAHGPGAHEDVTKAVILAGGRGTRLAPYTSILPKPLMPVGEHAILEILVDQLADQGLNDISLCVGYLSHLIRAVFDSRPDRRASITYVQEESALGTAGPLRLVPGLEETFVAMNGDVLTTLDFRALVRHHRESGNVFTVATHERTVKINYGVVYLDGQSGDNGRVEVWEEKPEIASLVSMGIYVIEPRALDFIPHDRFDIPDLIQALLAAGEPVGAFLHRGLWFDIGRHDDYEQAVAVWLANREVHDAVDRAPVDNVTTP